MPTLARDIVGDVVLELAQVPGVSTQTYASPRILQFVQDAVQLEAEAMWWPELMVYFFRELDGTTGHVTGDLVGPISIVDNYGDITAAWAGNSNRRIREFPPNSNPRMYMQSANSGNPGGGSGPLYMAADYTYPNRPVVFYPSIAAGSVSIQARQHHKLPLTLADNVYIDRLLITYDAAWMYATDDGTIPAQVTRFEMLAVKRRQQLLSKYAQQPLALDPRYVDVGSITDGWFTLNETPLA